MCFIAHGRLSRIQRTVQLSRNACMSKGFQVPAFEHESHLPMTMHKAETAAQSPSGELSKRLNFNRSRAAHFISFRRR
jgi:hypothetical protein